MILVIYNIQFFILIGLFYFVDVNAECLGEFSQCPDSGECSMGPCGRCLQGEYLCPSDGKTCVAGAAEYVQCPDMIGTHFDWTLTENERLSYLIKNTSLEEKISQLTNNAPSLDRLGIPMYNWLNDDLHGVALTDKKATVFPNGCGLGATWSKKTLLDVGLAIGTEARGLHNSWVHEGIRGQDCNGCGITIYAPNLNLVRDPRWGRSQEVYGEDPHHMGRLVLEFVRGIQNNTDSNQRYLLAAACCKHFAAYDVEGNRFSFDANITARNMWESHMPAFQACIVEAKASHVMCSYNKINGVPACGDPKLLNGILRERWDWDGFVVSDYDAWLFMKDPSGYVNTLQEAATVGINAGLDQEGGGDDVIRHLKDAINNGTVKENVVAQAFSRLFRVRIRLGMLDPPNMVPYNTIPGSIAMSSNHLHVARRAARESICLYKNSFVKDNYTLPLNSQKLAHGLAVIGPQATMPGLLMGNYADSASRGAWGSSILEELRATVKPASVVHSQGCLNIECNTTVGFDAAIAAAKNSSAIIVILGLKFDYFCYPPWSDSDIACESEGMDRQKVELPANQTNLVLRLRAAYPDKPLIGVLIHGGTLAMNSVMDALDALIDGWYPGIEGAAAIADVLFGKYNPAGRTAVTWYKATSQLPPLGEMDFYAGDGVTYRYFKGDVMIPFGFGLSYTHFKYTNLKLNVTKIDACDNIGVTVMVTNVGTFDGDEVIQVYVRQSDATVPVPRIQLASFERVFIARGKTKNVQLTVRPNDHISVIDHPDIYQASVLIEEGRLELFVGGGQPDYFVGHLSGSVNIENTKNIQSC